MGAVFIITRQKKKTRTESARIKNQKCGISKKFRCCRRTDRSCRDRARGSLHRPGSSGLPASGMFLRSLDRVFRDTASFRSVISRLPPRHEVPPSLSWQVPYPVSSRGRSIQLSPQLRRDEHIVMSLH